MDDILALHLSVVEGTNSASSLLVSNSDVMDTLVADLVILEKFIVDILLQVFKTQKQSLYFMCLYSVNSVVSEMDIM